MVETKFFQHGFTFFMPNLSVFFPCQNDVKNPWFITCDDTRSYHRVMCMLHQKFLGYADSCSFILISQLFVYHSQTHFCVTLSGKNVLYVENFNTVFIYQQILNFTNCKPSVAFKICEHRMSHFISQSVVQSTTSSIVVNVFPLLAKSVDQNL